MTLKKTNEGWSTNRGNFWSYSLNNVPVVDVYFDTKNITSVIEQSLNMRLLLMEAWEYLVNEKQLTNLDLIPKIENLLYHVDKNLNLDDIYN